MPIARATLYSSLYLFFCLHGLTGSELRLFKNLSQSVRRRLTNLRFRDFLSVFYRRSRVFLWVASADIACLSVYDANGALSMVC